MKPRSATELLDTLEERARENRRIVVALKTLPDDVLSRRPAPKAWSALEALEHLNIWNNDYLSRTENEIAAAENAPAAEFTSGWLGNKFAAAMKPGNNTRKIPTLKRLRPAASKLDRSVIDTWLTGADQQLALLTAARSADLNRVKVKTALSSFITMRLGDVLRMIVYHQWRHVEQAERATRGEAGIRTT